MNEFEYCFKVHNLEKVIDYLKEEGFSLLSANKQIRTIFQGNGFIARITKDYIDDNIYYSLDFKEDKITEEFTIRKESLPLSFTDEKAALSIIEFLGYPLKNEVTRFRWVLVKDEVKCELDEYSFGDKVVAVEGDNEKAEIVYKKLKELKA